VFRCSKTRFASTITIDLWPPTSTVAARANVVVIVTRSSHIGRQPITCFYRDRPSLGDLSSVDYQLHFGSTPDTAAVHHWARLTTLSVAEVCGSAEGFWSAVVRTSRRSRSRMRRGIFVLVICPTPWCLRVVTYVSWKWHIESHRLLDAGAEDVSNLSNTHDSDGAHWAKYFLGFLIFES